ncbi:hypothetical protein B0H11DRAFT_1352560 [Mycena galericulata]|nr:hypothetical protein B0H11DRAFT_1352560 [Mycena galericulata]
MPTSASLPSIPTCPPASSLPPSHIHPCLCDSSLSPPLPFLSFYHPSSFIARSPLSHSIPSSQIIIPAIRPPKLFNPPSCSPPSLLRSSLIYLSHPPSPPFHLPTVSFTSLPVSRSPVLPCTPTPLLPSASLLSSPSLRSLPSHRSSLRLLSSPYHLLPPTPSLPFICSLPVLSCPSLTLPLHPVLLCAPIPPLPSASSLLSSPSHRSCSLPLPPPCLPCLVSFLALRPCLSSPPHEPSPSFSTDPLPSSSYRSLLPHPLPSFLPHPFPPPPVYQPTPKLTPPPPQMRIIIGAAIAVIIIIIVVSIVKATKK